MKKILLSLLILFVGILSFCIAEDLYRIGSEVYSIGGSADAYFSGGDCLLFHQGLTNYQFYDINGNQFTSPSGYGFGVICSSVDFYVHNTKSYNQSFYTLSKSVPFPSSYCGGGSCPECPICPEVNTGEILSGYILESEIDTNFCVSNDLCPVYENNSLLYINNIEHQSAPVIDINIPLEYDWDTSINSGTFFLSISGNNVDYDYIDGIITTQNAKPSTEDFNKIITGLIPLFVPGLVIILFLRFVFKFVKKIF